jgi:hypothetical protein
MRNMTRIGWIVGVLVLAASSAKPQTASSGQRSLVILFNDGHQQSFPMADIARIEFKGSAMIVSQAGHPQSFPVADIARIEFNTSASSTAGRGRFLGKWKVGDGAGSDFYITLERAGEAHKSNGESHGTWVVVDGEARIAWDDGWHDAIRKVGSKFEKVAFEPGKSFSDVPSNITRAENTAPEPI